MWIISVPAAGQLYQTVDGISLGAAIINSSLPVLVTNPSFALMYVNTVVNLTLNGQATFGIDGFTYQPRVTYNQSTFISASVCNFSAQPHQITSDSASQLALIDLFSLRSQTVCRSPF